jgi:pimeloyl-ACP methyl ester carboxylesterase
MPNRKAFYKPKVLMSIHGYKSSGAWQDELTAYLDESNIKSAPYKYGYKIFRVLPIHILKDMRRFRDWYFELTDNVNYGLKIDEPFHRPSVMAHSLGTWILVKMLARYPEVKFDKIFLFGSIVPANFDWFQLLLRDQVNCVIYEKAKKDRIAPLGFIFTGNIRPCGTQGFVQKSSFIREQVLPFDHGDFKYKAHFFHYIQNWLPKTPHQLKVVAGRDLTEHEILKFFKETEKFDTFFYAGEYTENEISDEQAISWFRIEKDIWSFVLNAYTGSPVGYINAIPVSDGVYGRYCSGELPENEISATDILDYDTCTSYNLVIPSIAVKRFVSDEDTSLLKGRIAEMLIMSFIYKIDRHNNGRRKLKKIAAFAWTNEGVKLCEGFCMKRMADAGHPHPLYEVDLTRLTKEDIAGANFMSRWWYKKYLHI